MAVFLHKGDLPDDLDFGPVVAMDTETLGLKPHRDPLCLAQLSAGNGDAHLVQFDRASYDAPNMKALLTNSAVTKLFHYARFDVAALEQYLGVVATPLYCTKIASKLVRTYTDRHGLKDLCRELLGIDMSKQQQSSDWGAEQLSEAQLEYAAADVLYLHKIREALDEKLVREGRAALAKACFEFLPMRAKLDLAGWDDMDIFAH